MYSVDVVYAQEVVPHFIQFTPIFGGVVSLGFACLWYGACCWHDFSMRWLLRIRSARVDRNKNFDLRREYFYIDRCVKFNIYFQKRHVLFHACVTCSELPSSIRTMAAGVPGTIVFSSGAKMPHPLNPTNIQGYEYTLYRAVSILTSLPLIFWVLEDIFSCVKAIIP